MRRPLDVARIAETLARRWVGEDNLRLERLRARWPALVGQTVARRTFPARIDGATLWIHVHDEQWLHEMRWLRQPLVDRLSATDVGAGLTTLEFRRGHVPAASSPAARDPASRANVPPVRQVPPAIATTTAAGAEPVQRRAEHHEAHRAVVTEGLDETLRAAIEAIEDPELRARLTKLAATAAAQDL